MDAKAIHDKLVARFGEKVTGAGLEAASPFSVVATDAIAEVAAFCKADPDLAFDNLMCQSAVDYPKETPPRMEVVYHLLSFERNADVRVKVALAGDGAGQFRLGGDCVKGAPLPPKPVPTMQMSVSKASATASALAYQQEREAHQSQQRQVDEHRAPAHGGLPCLGHPCRRCAQGHPQLRVVRLRGTGTRRRGTAPSR